MSNAYFTPPVAFNEPVRPYEPGSEERESLLATYKSMLKAKMDVPMYIGGEEVRTGDKVSIHPPHDHKKVLGHYHKGGEARSA